MKKGGSLSFLVGTIGNVLVMEIGWTDVGSWGYILVSCAHSNTSLVCYSGVQHIVLRFFLFSLSCVPYPMFPVSVDYPFLIAPSVQWPLSENILKKNLCSATTSRQVLHKLYIFCVGLEI